MATGTAATVEEAISEQSVADAWKAYQVTEKHGLEFGKACYEYRAKHGAQGVEGKGLAQLLRKLGIKEGKAYYWINEYEVSIGVKERKERIIKEAPTVLAYSKEYDRCAACGVESIAGTKHTCANPTGKWKPVKGWVKGFPPRTPFEMADYKVFETSNQEGEWTRPALPPAPARLSGNALIQYKIDQAKDKAADKEEGVKTRQESHRENVDNAKGWLIAYLEDGPRSTKPINYRQTSSTAKTKEGRDVGRPLTRVTNSAGQITTTFAQAVKELGIITKSTGKGGHTWELPVEWDADVEDSPVLDAVVASPVPVSKVRAAVQVPECSSDTKKLQLLFKDTGLNLKASTAAFSGIKSVAGRYDLCGLSAKQVKLMAKALRRK